MLTVKQVRDAVFPSADSVGKNKDGHIVVRHGFFYRNGYDAEQFVCDILSKLMTAGIDAKLVDHGEVWKSFRGGATLANSSHWYVVLA